MPDKQDECDLQASLTSALAEGRRLREEVRRLKEILAQHSILFQEQTAPQPTRERYLPAASDIAQMGTLSDNPGKIALFRSLFRGRQDVYAERWRTKDGTWAYRPAGKKDWQVVLASRPSEHKKVDRQTRKVGTIFEDSAIGLDKWLCAMWMLANCKNGISSYEIARCFEVTQKTAWFMLQRIRYAMHHGSIDKMTGTVEADETFIGGKARFMHAHRREAKIHGRGPMGKAIVFGLLERETGRVRTHHVATRRKGDLQAIVRAEVEPKSALYTDALKSYDGLDEYVHNVIDHAEAYVDGAVHTNRMENFWSLLKRSIRGTYVSVEPFHLFRYLDEQSFRYNERKSTDAERFQKVLGSVAGKRLTWNTLTSQEAGQC